MCDVYRIQNMNNVQKNVQKVALFFFKKSIIIDATFTSNIKRCTK